MLRARKIRVNNVDVNVLFEDPKISPHRDEIHRQMAELLEVSTEYVNVKATTAESSGFSAAPKALPHRPSCSCSTRDVFACRALICTLTVDARAPAHRPRCAYYCQHISLAPSRSPARSLPPSTRLAPRRAPRSQHAPVPEPEDFVVEEDLGFTASGAGRHVLLKVRDETNARWLSRELAKLSAATPATSATPA